MLNRSGAVGTEALMSVLKNYCRSLNLKTAITVGVIGYPNVGKSSLINSLKRCARPPPRPAPRQFVGRWVIHNLPEKPARFTCGG